MDEFEALALAAAAKKKRGERVGLGSRIMRGIKAFNDFSAGTQDAAMDGLTFGLADEMNAAAGSLTQPYGEALDAARTRQDEIRTKTSSCVHSGQCRRGYGPSRWSGEWRSALW